MAARTGAERYLEQRKADPAFAQAYAKAREEIELVDQLVRELDDIRERSGVTKAELARRASTQPEAVRRLLSGRSGANPTLRTLTALAEALDYELRLVARAS